MKRFAYSILGMCLLLAAPIGQTATQEGGLYTNSAKSKGLPFEMKVSETRRTPVKSYLKVPGFNERTAVQARWIMCVFTDLAMKRGFKFWTVVYPPKIPGPDQLVLAFSNSERSSPKELLGPDFAADRILGAEMNSVVVFQSFCKSAGFM